MKEVIEVFRDTLQEHVDNNPKIRPSHEFRRLTFAARVDWRTDCSRLSNVVNDVDLKIKIKDAVAYAAVVRISHACVPIFATLERMDAVLKSLKYVIVLALLLSLNCGAEARHVRHRNPPDVVRNTTVYDPVRVETRDADTQVVSVFDKGYYPLRYPGIDISYILYVTPPHTVDTTPPPAVESSVIPDPPDNIPVYARMSMALGMMVLLASLLYRVTGRYDDPAWQYNRIWPSNAGVTLVETRWWLPMFVSAGYCHARHYLRLR